MTLPLVLALLAASPDDSPSSALAHARSLYAELEYEQVIRMLPALHARIDSTLEQRIEAYRLEASARAAIGDVSDAERPFRLLLRLAPGYELPPGSPPKVLAAFRLVQADEAKFAQTEREAQRQRLASRLKLTLAPPASAAGGEPVELALQLEDPDVVVQFVRVPYRLEGERAFNTLALRLDLADALWKGALPAEATANSGGAKLEYYVEAGDSRGTLLNVGPRTIELSSGSPSTRRVLPKAVFAVGAALVVAAVAIGTTFALLQQSTRDRTASLLRDATSSRPADGAMLAALDTQTTQWGDGARASFVTAGGLAVLVGFSALFVRW